MRTDYLPGLLFVWPLPGWGVRGALVSALAKYDAFCSHIFDYACLKVCLH